MKRYELIHKHCYGARYGVEVGVWQGETSEYLLKHMPELTLYMVDWWRVLDKEEDRKRCSLGRIGLNKAQMDRARAHAESRTAFAKDRRQIFDMDALSAAKELPSDFFDFVFLDADHTELGTYSAMCAYWSVVKPGGWLCGHDYGHPSKDWGVAQAVRRFRDEFNRRVVLDDDGTWWIRKP